MTDAHLLENVLRSFPRNELRSFYEHSLQPGGFGRCAVCATFLTSVHQRYSAMSSPGIPALAGSVRGILEREQLVNPALKVGWINETMAMLSAFDEEEVSRMLKEWVSEEEHELVIRAGTGELVGLAQHRKEMMSFPQVVVHASDEYKAERRRIFHVLYSWPSIGQYRYKAGGRRS